jgi:hypothetical protein
VRGVSGKCSGLRSAWRMDASLQQPLTTVFSATAQRVFACRFLWAPLVRIGRIWTRTRFECLGATEGCARVSLAMLHKSSFAANELRQKSHMASWPCDSFVSMKGWSNPSRV